MPRFAGQRADGKYPYVVTTRWLDQETRELVWALDIQDAKGLYGFTRELHTTKKVRRATVHDIEEMRHG